MFFVTHLNGTSHTHTFPAPIQSVLGKMNEIAKHKAAIEDADTQNKVCNPRTSISPF